ncbi:MAG: excinuclease ABC subunit UvrC [Candidatus Omnitrophica bacterium]|nr:excinuclease ABC subunit UvrC [Candidatus Omnitrophota bacterium]
MAYLNHLKQTIKTLPDSPGVYLMKDAQGTIIYVGKAISLKKRVSSYFSGSQQSTKTKILVSKIQDIGHVMTLTEEEALILEAALIKEHMPKYNVAIKDDKAYPLLRLSVNERFPRLQIVRRKKNDKAMYFGPYTSGTLLRQALTLIRRLFPLRTCNAMPKAVCLNYHIQQCLGPCQGYVDSTVYKKTVDNLLLFLQGKKSDLISNLSLEMKQAAINHDYEAALDLRNQIESLSIVPIIHKRFKIADQIAELQSVLKLKHRPILIEGYDISNISGTDAVGSMVSFKNGYAFKSRYRRFKIKTVKAIDDYAMIKEVLSRRFSGDLLETLEMPDLLLIDGGKGHLKTATEQLLELKINLPIISLAKKFEHIYVQWQEQPIALALNSKALRLLVAIRNESHRFALNYHQGLRKKRMLFSELDTIAGIGPKRKQILLQSIDKINALKVMNIAQLKKIRGIDEQTAKNIIEHWKKY